MGLFDLFNKNYELNKASDTRTWISKKTGNIYLKSGGNGRNGKTIAWWKKKD